MSISSRGDASSQAQHTPGSTAPAGEMSELSELDSEAMSVVEAASAGGLSDAASSELEAVTPSAAGDDAGCSDAELGMEDDEKHQRRFSSCSAASSRASSRAGSDRSGGSSPGASSVASGNHADDNDEVLSHADEDWSEAEHDAWDDEERPEDGGDNDLADTEDDPDAHTQASMRAAESSRAGSDQAEADARLELEFQGGLDAARRD